MPSGTIASNTPASGSYQTVDYHGVIRSASVAQAAGAILADSSY